jgi:ribosomal protein S7
LKRALENTESTAWKTLSTKLPLVDPTSKLPTDSSGLSNLTLPEEVMSLKDTLSTLEVIGETENTSSTTSSPECYDSLATEIIAAASNVIIELKIIK